MPGKEKTVGGTTAQSKKIRNDGAKDMSVKATQSAMPPVEKLSSSEQPKKKIKLAKIRLEDFEGNVDSWFSALHEAAEPSLTKLERTLPPKPIELVTGNFKQVLGRNFSKVQPENGEGPLALVVSSSADRSCIAAKELRKCPGAIAKLFARHMKIPEQKQFLEKNAVGVAVGTPNRLLKLCEDGILKLDKLQYFVVDMHVDSKTFSVLTMPEVSRDFFEMYRRFVAILPQDVKVVLLNPDLSTQES